MSGLHMGDKQTSNTEVANALREMALFLEMEEVPFKPRAYEKAAYGILALERPLAEIYEEGDQEALVALPGVGKGIARRIAGMLETGTMEDLERLRKKTPMDLSELTAIEGIGPKKAHALWQALGIKTLADLKRSAEAGKIRELPHFGERSEQKILEALEFHEQAAGRRPLGEVLEIARRIESALSKVAGVTDVAVAGSIRRHRETVGDVDVLVASSSPAEVSKVFEQLAEVQAVLAHGPTKTLVRLTNGMDADLRVLAPESFGAALLYFTGSKAHNIAVRRIAIKLGLKLNEYGLFRGEELIAARTEDEVYAALGLSWIPPEVREDRGEVQLAQRGELPSFVEAREIRGDLQVHTNWTDGSASIETMARAAKKLGREYIVITDHTRDLAMTGGMDEDKLLAQVEEIRKVDHALPGIRVLAGVEVNIRADGSLDISDEALAGLDVVGAAVHSHFGQPREEMTRRLIRAIENPHVDLLFHPCSRALGRRRAIDFDFDAIVKACLRTGTVLEIDSQPERLDLPDDMVRTAIEAGVLVALDSDAHSVQELGLVDTFGVGVARRGWAQSKHVINTLPLDQMLGMLKSRRVAQQGPGPSLVSNPSSNGHKSELPQNDQRAHAHDKRHRGQHPDDAYLFREESLEVLRIATFEVSRLLDRGYSERAALAVVGNRHALRARQRLAVKRCACATSLAESRWARRIAANRIVGRDVAIDGFNVIIGIEAALSGGLTLVGIDGAHRDLASVHGSYREVAETTPAIMLLGGLLREATCVRWFLDRPVSNSGRLKAAIEELAKKHGWPWSVELVYSPDKALSAMPKWLIATSDGPLLDQVEHWVDLPGHAIATLIPWAWRVDLRPQVPAGVSCVGNSL